MLGFLGTTWAAPAVSWRDALSAAVKTRRQRLDTEMVRRGLVSSRATARHLIDNRSVRVNGSLAEKASRLVHPGEAVVLVGDPPRYVSRGGQKLSAALQAFAVDPTGLKAIDVGASTGGFTDCLLQHGVVAVVAIDVGRNQLHERLKADPRVTPVPRTDVRGVDLEHIGGTAPLVVADLSFISLRAVAVQLCRLASAELVVLVKPQFEAGKEHADKARGVIRDPEVWRLSLHRAGGSMTDAGAVIKGIMVSPITGSAGNVEFFVHADMRADAQPLAKPDEAIEKAIENAVSMFVAGGTGQR